MTAEDRAKRGGWVTIATAIGLTVVKTSPAAACCSTPWAGCNVRSARPGVLQRAEIPVQRPILVRSGP